MRSICCAAVLMAASLVLSGCTVSMSGSCHDPAGACCAGGGGSRSCLGILRGGCGDNCQPGSDCADCNSGSMNGVHGCSTGDCGSDCGDCTVGMNGMPGIGMFPQRGGRLAGCGQGGCGLRGHLCGGCKLRARHTAGCGCCEDAAPTDCEQGDCNDCARCRPGLIARWHARKMEACGCGAGCGEGSGCRADAPAEVVADDCGCGNGCEAGVGCRAGLLSRLSARRATAECGCGNGCEQGTGCQADGGSSVIVEPAARGGIFSNLGARVAARRMGDDGCSCGSGCGLGEGCRAGGFGRGVGMGGMGGGVGARLGDSCGCGAGCAPGQGCLAGAGGGLLGHGGLHGQGGGLLGHGGLHGQGGGLLGHGGLLGRHGQGCLCGRGCLDGQGCLAGRHPYGGAMPHTYEAPQTGGIAPQYAYPYYTNRGPRDFLQNGCGPAPILPYSPNKICLPTIGY